TNLFFAYKLGQGKQITHFVNVFAKTLEDFSDAERRKYPESWEPAKPKEVIITPEVAKKLSPTVRRYRETNHRLPHTQKCQIHTWNGRPVVCHCPEPFTNGETQMWYWIDYLKCTCCLSYHNSMKIHNDTVELTKTLLLYNEVEILLRIASQPDVDLQAAWSFPWDLGCGYGVSELIRSTLMAYICMNVLYLKPELYDPACRKDYLKNNFRPKQPRTPELELDYRKAFSYQKMLCYCTGERHYDTYTYPHRQFFGVLRGTYQGDRWQKPDAGVRGPRYGDGTSKDKGPLKQVYVPFRSDISRIHEYLYRKGLPIELRLIVMEYAEYVPQRRLPVPNDPFHSRNAEELRKYLSYLWKVLVLSDMMVKACGTRIDWENEIGGCIEELWCEKSPKMVEHDGDERRPCIGGGYHWKVTFI
ncbi:hypothetical protein B0J14DRAFT_493962, partial [Halenospora varia]